MIIKNCLPKDPESYFLDTEYSYILRTWCKRLTEHEDRLIYNLISSVCSVAMKDSEFASRLYKDTHSVLFERESKEERMKRLIEQYKKAFQK